MNKRMSLLLVMVLIVSTLAMTSCGGDKEAEETQSLTVSLATGGKSGTYYDFARTSAAEISNLLEDVSFDIKSKGTPVSDIRLVASGETDIAIVQSDIVYYAYNGRDIFEGEKLTGFSAMAACYAEPCQLVVAADSGIETVADLAGKTVSVGDTGSDVEFNAKQILKAYGMTVNNIKAENLGYENSVEAIKEDEIDAFFCTAGAPATSIVELSLTNGVKVIDIKGSEAEKLMEDYPFYTSYTIPAGTYYGQESDVTTVALKAMFIVNNNLAEDVVYNITKALFESKDVITEANVKGAELDKASAVEGLPVSLHPGAKKYYEEAGVL